MPIISDTAKPKIKTSRQIEYKQKETASKPIRAPETFSIDPNKMRSKPVPEKIKKAGIDSLAYKQWIWKNWT